jgi:hypothetical protein
MQIIVFAKYGSCKSSPQTPHALPIRCMGPPQVLSPLHQPPYEQKLIVQDANYCGCQVQNKNKNFIYIFPKSFMIFCQELIDPKRNYKNQI